jgi:hypothetical protein
MPLWVKSRRCTYKAFLREFREKSSVFSVSKQLQLNAEFRPELKD